MIDEFGHVIHIDFGFVIDISPGNNMKFEKAAEIRDKVKYLKERQIELG